MFCSSPFEDTVQVPSQSPNPGLASAAGKAAILLPSKARQVTATEILPSVPSNIFAGG